MKNTRNGCEVNCFLCSKCLPEWHPAITTNKKTFLFKRGDEIFKEGDPVTGIYFIYNGVVKVHKKWGTEKELIIRFAKDGDILGHRGIGEETTYPVSCTALETTSACFIDLDFFDSTLQVNTNFTISLLWLYADELQRSERKMNNLAHMHVKGRVADALLALKKKFGVTREGAININISRQDLASFAGTTYETVFRILNEFSQEGIISTNHKDIFVLKEEPLLACLREINH